MARKKTELSTSVNFRMPNSILTVIDEMARKNNHERTSEINNACKYWIEIGGSCAADKTTYAELKELRNTVDLLKLNNAELKSLLDALSLEVGNISHELRTEHQTMLSILAQNESNLGVLLAPPAQYKKN